MIYTKDSIIFSSHDLHYFLLILEGLYLSINLKGSLSWTQYYLLSGLEICHSMLSWFLVSAEKSDRI
jgi:hypothetical protein